MSDYEADVLARWRCARSPTEAEGDTASAGLELAGNFVETGSFHPAPVPGSLTSAERGGSGGLRQTFGDVSEWTRSDYAACPGFRPLEVAVEASKRHQIAD